jgi:D-amino-acid dehydrogenase
VNHNTTHTQIAIIGGGISGICTAYFLALVGYEVAVIERHSNVAEEATLGNSGLMAPASISPLALPGLISTGITGPRRPF